MTSSLAKIEVNNSLSGLSWEMSVTAKTHIFVVLLLGEFFSKLALEMQDDESPKSKAILSGVCKRAYKLLSDRRDCMGQCYRLAIETLERQNTQLFPTYSAINKIRMKYRKLNDQGKESREVNLRYKENPTKMRELRGVLRTNELSGNALRYKVLSYLTVHDLLVTEQIDLQESSANQHITKSQYYRERVRFSRGSLAFDPTVYAKVKNLKYELQVLEDSDSDSVVSYSMSEKSEDEPKVIESKGIESQGDEATELPQNNVPTKKIENNDSEASTVSNDKSNENQETPTSTLLTKSRDPAMTEGQKVDEDNGDESTKSSTNRSQVDVIDPAQWDAILNHSCQQGENPTLIKPKTAKSNTTFSTADSDTAQKEISLPLKSCMQNTIAKLKKRRALGELFKPSIILLKAFHRLKGNKQAIRCQFITAFDLMPFNEEAARKIITNDFVFYFFSTPTIPEWRDKRTTYNEANTKNYCGKLVIKCSQERESQQQMSTSSMDKLNSQIFLQKPDNFDRSSFIKQLLPAPWAPDPFSATSPVLMVVDHLVENDEPPYGYIYRRTVQCASKKKSEKVEREDIELLDEGELSVELGNPNCKDLV